MTTATAAPATQISYQDLYSRWERGNWSATEIDFSVDKEHWAALTEFERTAALWNYTLFFHGEDVVATDLAPFIDAAPREEQRYFLATQQADEARHAVFFKRFFEEVAGVRGHDGSMQAALDLTRPSLTWGFVKTFEMLDRITDELRRDRSRVALARAVFMYHFVVEAALAQPGQHFIENYLDERGILPGFRAGMRNVSLDEQRHIGFGVRLLHDLAQEDPDVPEAVADVLRAVAPISAGVIQPPGGDRRYTEAFGFTLEEIFEEGTSSLESKLRAAGMPLESLPGPIPFPLDIPPRERAVRAVRFLETGLLGAPNGAPLRDPDTMALLFDQIARSVDHRKAPAQPITLEWDFSDAEPWHVRVDNGSTAAVPGRAAKADVTLRCSYDDFVDVLAGRADPQKLFLRGRLRPRGSLRSLWAARNLFPREPPKARKTSR